MSRPMRVEYQIHKTQILEVSADLQSKVGLLLFLHLKAWRSQGLL